MGKGGVVGYLEELEGGAGFEALHFGFFGEVVFALAGFPSC